jgi:Zn finger protein HypA/HybF involved in hydrogenase expression
MPAHGTFRIITVEDRRPAIVCLLCRHTSHNVHDVVHRYCPACHMFHDVVMEARAYHAAGMTHECDDWRTAADVCAICHEDLA